MPVLIGAFFSGIIFAIGLGIGGMTDPSKVVGFLDFFGNWNPTLAFVMGGGIGVHAICYRLIRKRNSPIFEKNFSVPTRKDLDPKLLIGSGLFGIGWGIGGFCPGPGIASLPTGAPEILSFVVLMIVGMIIGEQFLKRINS